MTPTKHRRFLSMGYAAVSQSLSCSTRIRNAWPVHRAAQFGMLTFSFSPLFPRMLPRHSLLFHSTSFNFLTGAGGASPFVFPAPPLCSSLECISQSKFGSVISGWLEPVFLRIILRAGLKLQPTLDIDPWSALALIQDSSTRTLPTLLPNMGPDEPAHPTDALKHTQSDTHPL